MAEENGAITCRAATEADIEALADLRWQMSAEYEAGEVTRQQYVAAFREAIADEMARGRYRAWLAEADGRPVACTALIWWPMPPNLDELHRRRGYVSSVFTHPDYRRQRLARTLMEMLLAEARARADASGHAMAGVGSPRRCAATASARYASVGWPRRRSVSVTLSIRST